VEWGDSKQDETRRKQARGCGGRREEGAIYLGEKREVLEGGWWIDNLKVGVQKIDIPIMGSVLL
jgi:hypothetical protein